MAGKRNPIREDSFSFLAEVIEKMIDAQINNAESIVSIKDNMTHINNSLENIKGHFTNGFRSEIKEHMTEEIKKCIQKIDSESKLAVEKAELAVEKAETAATHAINAYKTVDEIKINLNKPSFWLKLLIGFIIAIGSISGGLLAISNYLHDGSKNTSNKALEK